jgi:hypothetical protein
VLWFVKSTVAGASGHYVESGTNGLAPVAIDLSGGSANWSPDDTRLLGSASLAGGTVFPNGLRIVDPTGVAAAITISTDGVPPLGWSWQSLP